jgi:hypothetical protein
MHHLDSAEFLAFNLISKLQRDGAAMAVAIL